MDILDKDFIKAFNIDMEQMEELKKSAVGKRVHKDKTPEERRDQEKKRQKRSAKKRKALLS
jgi:hypothetical protein